MENTTIKIVVVAGGTGGHLFPAMAVVEALEQLTGGSCSVDFIGTSTRIESTVVPRAGYRFHTIPATGLQKRLSLSAITFALNMVRSVIRSRTLLLSLRPDIVLCAGAYISYPVGFAASLLRIPLFIMESNVYPGKAILQLAPKAQKIFTAFEETIKYLHPRSQQRAEVTGNPVRGSLTVLPEKQQARIGMGLNPIKPTVLCFGGSLGANSINQVVEKSLRKFVDAGIQLIWQTGNFYMPAPENIPPEMTAIYPFIDDMASAYAAADLIVCRAGATSIAELCLTGKPAILVPYPHAANNHQEINAKIMEHRKAAFVITDSQLDSKLVYTIISLLTDREKLQTMSENAKALANEHAAKDIARSILNFVQTQKQTGKNRSRQAT